MSPGENVFAGNKLHRALNAELDQAGCFRQAPWITLGFMVFVLTVYSACYVTLLLNPSAVIRISALLILAFACVHAGFIAHEAGYGAITRNRRTGAVVGQIFDTFLIGLCYVSFRNIHRLHHSRCNEEAADPNYQSTARLRTARPITKAFCQRHGLIYREMNWPSAARKVSLHFSDISRFVAKKSWQEQTA